MSKIGRNIFWLTLSRLAAWAILFFAYTQLFRYLGPVGSGQFQYVLSFIFIFTTLVDLGIHTYIIQTVSREKEQARKYFFNFLAFEIIIAPLVYLLSVAIAYFQVTDPVVLWAIVIGGLGIIMGAITLPFMAVISAFQDLKKVALAQFLVSAVNAVFIFSAVIFQLYIVFLASAAMAANLVILILYARIIKRYIGALNLSEAFRLIDFSLIKSLIKVAWPFMLLVGFAVVYNRIDVLIMKFFLDYEQVGLYSAAYKFFDLLGFFPAVVYASLYPFFSAKRAELDKGEIRTAIEKYFRFMSFVGLPMAVGGMILARQLIILIAGTEFVAAAPVLSILVWGSLILFIYSPANALIIAHLTKKAAAVTGVNVAVNIIGNIILIPIIGIKAAAIMTLISESVQAFFYYFFIYRGITPFHSLRFVVKPLVGAAVMGLGLWYIRDWPLYLTLPIGAVVYFGVMWILRFYTKEDLLFVKNFLKKEATP